MMLMGIRSVMVYYFEKMVDLVNRPGAGAAKRRMRNTASGENSFSGGFFLDKSSKFEASGNPYRVAFPRWMDVIHCVDPRHSLIIVACEQLEITDVATIEKDTHAFVRFGSALSTISSDGMVFELLFTDDEKTESEIIASFHISGGLQPPYWREANIDLSYLAGQRGSFLLRCNPGSKNDPTADWLAIPDFCVAREDLLPLMKARTNYELRYGNEIANFRHVYEHDMYSGAQGRQAETAGGQVRPVRSLNPKNADRLEQQFGKVHEIEPTPHESAFDYGSRLLSGQILQARPDFVNRLMARAEKGGTVRVLSLCSGAARVEAEYANKVGSNVEWSLIDINPDLLTTASKQFAPGLKIDLIEANVNELTYSGEKWDIILIISALHHLVELERIVQFCHDSLNEGGEFWCIGECVGRNGNQLWPEARVEANRIFQDLPEKYRKNRNTGKVDSEIPVNDFSVGCFEGIRSEEIEPVVERWFNSVEVYRSNCMLWRLLDLSYNDNYDLQVPEDRLWIVKLVEAELNHFRQGGRGTELFGIYSPRLMG
jgi:SAM-dependent methyltransferase